MFHSLLLVSKLKFVCTRSESELALLRQSYEEMERIAGSTTMTVEVVSLPRPLVHVLGEMVRTS